MAVTFDALGPSSSGAQSSASPLTWSHTCGALATVLLVGIAVDPTGTDGSMAATATYNGVAMTSLKRWESGGSSKDVGWVQVFYLESPPTGTAYTVSVSVTPSASYDIISGGSLSFAGSASLSTATTADSAGANVSSGTISVPTTAAANMVAVFACDGSDTLAFTAGTSRLVTTGSGDGAAGAVAGATIAATGSNVTVSWTQASDMYAAIGVEIQAGGGGSPAPFAPPRKAARGGPAVRRGTARGGPGAPYTAPAPVTPSPFTPPRGPARGAPAARRGASAGKPGAPYAYVPPPVPSPFTAPRGPARGRMAAGPGTSSGARGAWSYAGVPSPFTAPGKPARGRPAARKGSSRGGAGAPYAAVPAVVVNQWANGYAQGTTMSTLVPLLQSCVVPLTSEYSAGSGSGTPTAGNWLFTLASWTQDPALADVHVGVQDDIRSWWREFPPAGSGGQTRTTISYTPNTVRAAGNVYVAPDGPIAAITVLVVEVSGLGPWDTVGTGAPATGYAAAAESLSLSLGAPGAAAFWIGAVGGDNTAAGQAFHPSGWSTLSTVSESDGSDQLASSCLTSAYLASSSSSQSVSGSATTAEDLSGFLLSVWMAGADPIPAAQNPDWPHFVLEAGFGSGFNTPDSEITWTDITSRLWSWDETTGAQYQLGQIQATDLTLELDDWDGNLKPENSASPYFPYCQDGTPLRLRAAIGTIGGVTQDRWYVIQRNAQDWTEQIDENYRRYCEVTGTDLWAALSAVAATFYRAAVYADQPYAWWPMDDQPGAAGVQPTSLLNAAPGNTSELSVVISPNGATAQQYESEAGVSASGHQPPGVGTYAAGQSAGWMYGDPTSSQPYSYASSGGPVTATPGSAAWQASGQAGSTGSYGWFLSCNDSGFPPLSGGVTIECWWNYGFYGSTYGWEISADSLSPLVMQPYSTPLTIWEIATGSEPVAILQLSTSGYLELITYSGSTPAGSTIYNSSDLRSNSWHSAVVTLTETTWAVWLDGGEGAYASGTAAGMTSAWTWLIANGDLGTHGGSSAGTGLVHGGNVSLSHLSVYPSVLPAWRILDHYWAAVSSYGLLPAPSGVAATFYPAAAVDQGSTSTPESGAFAPDGSNGVTAAAYASSSGVTASALVAATAGSVTSGPSARAISSGVGVYGKNPNNSFLWIGWTGLAPGFTIYTAASAGSETGAAVVNGSGGNFNSGYGSGASGNGSGQTSGGSGASPPSAPTAVGDSVAQRIERLMLAGKCISPNRCIDPAPLLVQAPGTAGGGNQAGTTITELQQSDSGLLYVDNLNNLSYWQRPHLAAQYSSPVWAFGPSGSEDPYYRDIKWPSDPQRVWDVVQVSPFSPDGTQLPVITPTNTSGVEAAQLQYGAQPQQIISWLQSTSEMQNQANFLFANYGQPVRRVENLKIDAAPDPSLWPAVVGINVGDVITVEDWQIGGGGPVSTYRVSQIERHIEFGGRTGEVIGSCVIKADFEPTSYWS